MSEYFKVITDFEEQKYLDAKLTEICSRLDVVYINAG